jgi:tetratricopeptide (TPR) repeat protein
VLDSVPRPSRRAVGIAIVLVLAVAALVTGGWFWLAAYQQRSLDAYAAAFARARANRGSPPAPSPPEAVQELEAALRQYPSAALAPQAAYELANLKYEARDYPGARAAYEITLGRGHSATLRTLARAGIGYTWEAERNYAKAAEVFEVALGGSTAKPGDFFGEQFLLDLARVQELAGRRDDAIRTYQRVLENPKSRRGDDVRARLAALGVAP